MWRRIHRLKNPTTSSGNVGYSYDIAHDYFEQNTDDFPIGSFGDFKLPSMIGVKYADYRYCRCQQRQSNNELLAARRYKLLNT